MSEQKPPELLTPLSITEKQRDVVTVQFHNLERDKALLLQAVALKDKAIADLSAQLAEARARITELEVPGAQLRVQGHMAHPLHVVGEAGSELSDAAAG